MNNIAFIYSGKANGLDSLPHNIKAVKKSFDACDIWKTLVYEELKSYSMFVENLNTHITDEVDNLLIYYTGHAEALDPEKKELSLLLNEPRLIQELFNAIFKIKYINAKKTKVAIVLDACFSEKFIAEAKSWTNNLEILVSSSKHTKSTEENANSNLSLFSHYFCKALDALPRGHKKANLDTIRQSINGYIKKYESNKQYSYYDSPTLSELDEPMILSYKDTSLEELEELIGDLRELVTDEELVRFTRNLLAFNSVRIPEEFDALVTYLYHNYKETLICILKNSSDTELDKYIDYLLAHLNKDRSDIDNFCIEYENMSEDKQVLMVLIRGDMQNARVTIFEHKQGNITVKKLPFDVRLETEKGKALFVSTIVNTIVVSRTKLLLEFILPVDLKNEDIASWKNSEGIQLSKYFSVRRVGIRLDKSRIKKYVRKEWLEYWGFYRDKGTDTIEIAKAEEIDFIDFKETPYVQLGEIISPEVYKSLVDENACIVLAPLDKDDDLSSIENINMKDLVKTTFRKLRNTYPCRLTWDNPNRIITKETEAKYSKVQSQVGEIT